MMRDNGWKRRMRRENRRRRRRIDSNSH